MPLTTLKRVVLPAPLGPITPWIRPGSTASETPSSTATAPKRFTRLSMLSRATAPIPARGPARRPGPSGHPGRHLELRVGQLGRPDDLVLAVHELHEREEEALHEGARLHLV